MATNCRPPLCAAREVEDEVDGDFHALGLGAGEFPFAADLGDEELEDGEADVFYGPVTDAGGALRVPEGENLSDTELFDRLDWYVEGVVLR